MSRSADILFITEYIKDVLYFATVRPEKKLNSTTEAHFFCIDNELIYENFYSDFGPLNLGCVYKYCKILDEKINQFINKQVIVHYTSTDAKKKANAAFLIGCYGVLYLGLSPKDALKPLILQGQSYRPYQDAIKGDSAYTITLLDCLQAIAKAHELGFLNFQDFNYEEYDRRDSIEGGDLNWIVPGKFLAFIGPLDNSVSWYHPAPTMYIPYFLDNNVQIVIRLNKRLYDSSIFSDVGIIHYDLFFPDGSCPPRHILTKFLQISEDCDGGLAVHCKAGLGRTGTLIGCYLIKHYRMTAREAIGWMRICRPGSVIGHQQGWLEQLEAWLIKQGNIFRRRAFQDVNKLPTHEFGVYSIAEKSFKQRQKVLNKSPSPPPPIQRKTRSEISPVRPQISKIRDDTIEDGEMFLTSCDLTESSKNKLKQIKGCIIRPSLSEETNVPRSNIRRTQTWKSCFRCLDKIKFKKKCKNMLWMLAVRCAKIAPNRCYFCCNLFDMVVSNKAEKERFEWHVKPPKLNNNQTYQQRRVLGVPNQIGPRQSTGAGEPRLPRTSSRASSTKSQGRRSVKTNDTFIGNIGGFYQMPIFCPTQVPIMKNVSEAKNFLLRSSIYSEQRDKHYNSSIYVTPQYSNKTSNNIVNESILPRSPIVTPTPLSAVIKGPTQVQHRRRLGRSPSPSPPQLRMTTEHSRANQTMPEKILNPTRDSKSTLREALSRLKLSGPRDGSIGAASLGARREAPAPKRAPSVRSDERPLATQGDMLNSIKFQRILRNTLHSSTLNQVFNDKNRTNIKEKYNLRKQTSKTSTGTKSAFTQEASASREKTGVTQKSFFNSPRPSSPKGRRIPPFY